jgi:hypothetical protein
VIQGGVQRLALYALPAGACAWWAGPVLFRMTQHGDFPAHARFAEDIAATGQPTIPHFGYELGLIAVHAVWPGGGWSWAGFVVTLAGQLLTAGLLAHWVVRNTPECGRALRLAVAALLPLALLIAQPVLPASAGERDPWLIGYFPPNQYHNPTTLLSKPVALALVGVGVAALSGTQARIAASAALVLVSGLIKPSFLMAFLPAAGALALVQWRRARWSLLIAGMAVPASLLLVAQFALRYRVQADDGVSIVWAPLMVLGLYGPTDGWSLGAKLLRSVLFPVLVTALFLPGARRDVRLVLAWVIFAAGISYGYLLAEGGGKASAGDFLWSGQLAAFTLFAAAAAFLVAQIPTAGESRRRPFIDKRIELCVLVLGWHVASGLQHLRRSWLE